MSVYRGSRYEGERAPRLLSTDGRRRPALFRTRPVVVEDYTLHLVVDGDRLDQIAYRTYGEAELWWVIADANPDLETTDPLVPGTVLAVPTR